MTDARPAGVIFDLGGVLLTFDHMDICRDLSGVTGLAPEEIYRRVFTSGLEKRYDLGRVTTEEFYTEGLELLGITPEDLPREDFERIWADIFSENAEVTRLLPEVKKRARLFLLSNTNELHFGMAERRFSFLTGTFDEVFLSFRLGMRKPEPEVFEAVVGKTGLAPGELFYVDDDPGHVASARTLGIDSHVYTSPEGLADALAERGLLGEG